MRPQNGLVAARTAPRPQARVILANVSTARAQQHCYSSILAVLCASMCMCALHPRLGAPNLAFVLCLQQCHVKSMPVNQCCNRALQAGFYTRYLRRDTNCAASHAPLPCTACQLPLRWPLGAPLLHKGAGCLSTIRLIPSTRSTKLSSCLASIHAGRAPGWELGRRPGWGRRHTAPTGQAAGGEAAGGRGRPLVRPAGGPGC